jgi:hypothetical protein
MMLRKIPVLIFMIAEAIQPANPPTMIAPTQPKPSIAVSFAQFKPANVGARAKMRA